MYCLCPLQFLGIDVSLVWENGWNHIILSICLRSNIKNSLCLLTWDKILGTFLCSALYNLVNLCEGHCYKSVNNHQICKVSTSTTDCRAEPQRPICGSLLILWSSGRHFVGNNSPFRARGCHFSADPPLPFSSENSSKWKMSALSDVLPFPLGIDWFGEEVGWIEMQRCPLSLTRMAREEPCCA